MTPTILDMAQVFGLRPSGRYFSDQLFQDLFGNDVSSLCKEKFISCIQQRDLAWGVRSDKVGYERGLEVYKPNFCGRQLGFRQTIPVSFFDSLHCETSYHLRSPFKVTFRVSKCSLNVMSKITHKPVSLNFECTFQFTTWWKAKWSKKYDEGLREAHYRLFGQVGQTSSSLSSTLPLAMIVTPTSQFNPTIGEMLHFMEDDSVSSHVPNTTTQPLPTFGEPMVFEISVVFEVTNPKAHQALPQGLGKSPQPAVSKVALARPPKDFGVTEIPIPKPKKVAATEAYPSISFEAAITIPASGGAGVMPLHLASIPITTSLPELVREFRQIRTKLRALGDQHLRPERTSTSLQQLVEEGSEMEDMIMVLYQKIKEVKRVNQKVEDSEAQQGNNNIALEKLRIIFTIMQTYHSKIAVLAGDVNMLG
ncbi:hypothetical protein D8674_030614 [Pyrus ussuriensis x Pyrus communis]|uniref:TMV resistance protein N-like n=1 Tax=Pyrus ussuriensis x Pyrus communis TaxID=2448454 RepID=A0A5N5F940_9ROSA|nr:hypothetical protein D8674_030614 [Pyrus ussuriensis x Pyrus communis]